MEFEVFLLRRQGAIRSAFQRNHSVRRGHLVIEEQQDATLNRTVRVARLCTEPRGGQDLHPPLRDVQVVSSRDDLMTLTGFEVEDVGGTMKAFQQSWLLALVPEVRLSVEARREAERRLSEGLRGGT